MWYDAYYISEQNAALLWDFLIDRKQKKKQEEEEEEKFKCIPIRIGFEVLEKTSSRNTPTKIKIGWQDTDGKEKKNCE